MMTTKDYQEIVSSDIASPSSDPHHADYIRSFPLPSRFFCWNSDRDPLAGAGAPSGIDDSGIRTINIFFAFVGRVMTLVAIDPSRMIRYHCMVLNRHWSPDDLVPGSKVRGIVLATPEVDLNLS